jgi:hypothetical protein
MDYDYSIHIVNNSDIELRYAIKSFYPDTIPSAEKINAIVINARSPRSVEGGSTPWEYRYETRYPSDTMSLFLMSNDTLEKYEWDRVRDDYNVLIRYDLSVQDLYSLKFKVVYPPDERMADIKMWPPYGTVQ